MEKDHRGVSLYWYCKIHRLVYTRGHLSELRIGDVQDNSKSNKWIRSLTKCSITVTRHREDIFQSNKVEHMSEWQTDILLTLLLTIRPIPSSRAKCVSELICISPSNSPLKPIFSCLIRHEMRAWGAQNWLGMRPWKLIDIANCDPCP